MTWNARAVFDQKNGDVTKAFYAHMNKLGRLGEIGTALFRAQKRSTAAKSYRGRSYRKEAYEVKNWSISEVCRLLKNDPPFQWGWGHDLKTIGFPWVIYVSLPTGQVSFHSAERLPGPDYLGEWDGCKNQSEQRIIDFCNSLLGVASAGSTSPTTSMQQNESGEMF